MNPAPHTPCIRACTVGVIRVITEDRERTDAHGQLIERAFPQVRTVSRCIPDQPEGVHDAATKRAAEPKVVAYHSKAVAVLPEVLH